jgi:hypothetical protein
MKKAICFLIIFSIGICQGGINMTYQYTPSNGYLDAATYPNPTTEEEHRTQSNDLPMQALGFINDLDTKKESSANITTTRKLSATGDFTGTINGGDVTLTEPGLSGAFNAHLDEIAAHFNIPSAPELANKKIEIVAGVIRQDATDRTKWNYINDGNHVPVGVSGDYATALASDITINFGKTYSRVISFIAGVDEFLANAYQAVVGCSVGLSLAELKMSARIDADATIRYDGSNWVYTNTTGAALVTGVSGAGANITITHSFCPGNSAMLVPFTNGGAVVPYIPVLKGLSATTAEINFINPTTGAFVSVHDTKMCCRFIKISNEGLKLDGTSSYNLIPLDTGNIWFFGIFEV